MDKLELKKKLEKRKAYLVCLMLFLALSTPTVLIGPASDLTALFKVAVLGGIFLTITIAYTKMNRVRAQIKKIYRS